jgi:hypothetical protein
MENGAEHQERMGSLRRDAHAREELADLQGSASGAREMTTRSEPGWGNTSPVPVMK